MTGRHRKSALLAGASLLCHLSMLAASTTAWLSATATLSCPRWQRTRMPSSCASAARLRCYIPHADCSSVQVTCRLQHGQAVSAVVVTDIYNVLQADGWHAAMKQSRAALEALAGRSHEETSREWESVSVTSEEGGANDQKPTMEVRASLGEFSIFVSGRVCDNWWPEDTNGVRSVLRLHWKSCLRYHMLANGPAPSD